MEVQWKKVTEPQEDGQTIEKMSRNVMLMSGGMEEERERRVTGEDERERERDARAKK